MRQAPNRRSAAAARPAKPTRQRILDAAREQFAEHGYRSTSMRQVAAHAGLTDPALYYYFKSKREILTALLDGPDIESPAPSAATQEALLQQICGVFEAYSNDALLLRILLRGQLDHEVDSVTFRTRRVERLRRSLTPALETFYGESAPLKLQALEYLIFGMLWDGIIVYGKEWPIVAQQKLFQERTMRLFRLALGMGASGPAGGDA